jgi:HNH endonuclease
MALARTPLVERFWRKVRKTEGCWLWTGCVNGAAGYGAFNIGGTRMDRAHRVSWRLHFGAIPAGLCVCHHCDTRRCVRPEHLFLGTRDANNKDMTRKGRSRVGHVNRRKGERHGRAKLTDEQVRRIREVYRTTQPFLRVLAKEHGVTLQQIHRIVTGKGWRHISQ